MHAINHINSNIDYRSYNYLESISDSNELLNIFLFTIEQIQNDQIKLKLHLKILIARIIKSQNTNTLEDRLNIFANQILLNINVTDFSNVTKYSDLLRLLSLNIIYCITEPNIQLTMAIIANKITIKFLLESLQDQIAANRAELVKMDESNSFPLTNPNPTEPSFFNQSNVCDAFNVESTTATGHSDKLIWGNSIADLVKLNYHIFRSQGKKNLELRKQLAEKLGFTKLELRKYVQQYFDLDGNYYEGKIWNDSEIEKLLKRYDELSDGNCLPRKSYADIYRILAKEFRENPNTIRKIISDSNQDSLINEYKMNKDSHKLNNDKTFI